MNTNKKIKELLSKIERYIDTNDAKDAKWYKDVQLKASAFETEQEKLEYLEGILSKLKPNIWPVIVLAILGLLVIIVTAWYLLAPKSANTPNSSTTAASSTISKSVDLPKEDFKIADYIVSGNAIKPNPNMKNEQHKVFANGSSSDSLSDEKDVAIKEMTEYMAHNVSALKEKAMTFNIVDQNFDEKKWLENRNGSLYYNKEGQEIFYQVKAFLNRSKITSKVMENGSNYYTTGLNKDNKVVVSQSSQDLSGQRYLEVKNPEGSTEKYHYIVLVYCGNTVMKNNNIPGIPTEKIEIPPTKPGKPDKPSESKVEKKDPSKDPANQGKAPVGGGQNDGSENGTETTQAKLPESYSAPTAPSAPASSTAPSQDSRISEPSQWSGAGKITDSNGTTKVTDNGSVTTPDNRSYDGLVGKSAPKVEAGANGATAPSSSANFAGNSSMSEPAIDD
mgnify:CR=1 FL=1